MSDSLQHRLTKFRAAVRRVVWLQGLCWVVAVVVAAGLCVAWLDWFVHIDDAGIRLALGMGVVVAGAWIAWRTLVVPLSVDVSDVELATRIQSRVPALKDSLATSIEFQARGGDPAVGSPVLQHRVVMETSKAVERVDFNELISTRRLRQVAAAAVSVCLMTAIVAGINRSAAATAWKRFVSPFSNVQWPREVELRLLSRDFEPLEPTEGGRLQMARGRTLELYVENEKGALPNDIAIQYQFGAGEVVEEKLRTATLRDSGGTPREVADATLRDVSSEIRFRAVGGDDYEMPWYRVEVIPPPVVESLQVQLTPPPYTRRPVQQLPPGVGHVRGLIGTRVDIQAAVSRPISSAVLRIKDHKPLEVDLQSDRLGFAASFTLEETGTYTYWFELQDSEGFQDSDPPRYEIHGVADLAPDVVIEQPAEDLLVTPNAEVGVRISATDDLGLRDLQLQFKFGDTDDAGGFRIPLMATVTDDSLPEQLTADYQWNLSELSLAEGMRIVYRAEAFDAYDLGPERVGRSISRMLTIVSSEEKLAELSERQTGLLEELQRVREIQTHSRDHIDELRVQLEVVGRLRDADVDLLRRVELDQRQIAARLLSPIDGVQARTRNLQEELRSNHIDDAATESRLRMLADELELLSQNQLPAIEQVLTAVRKSAQVDRQRQRMSSEDGDEDAGKPAADSKSRERQQHSMQLAETRAHQTAVVESLDALVSRLSKWKNRKELDDQLDELLVDQRELAERTAETGRQTRGKPASSLKPQEQAELEKLADRQQRQSDLLDRFQEQLSAAGQQLDNAATDEAGTLADAAQLLRDQLTAGTMRDAARELAGNRIGRAAELQQRVLSELSELQQLLRNESSDDLPTLLRKIERAEQELTLQKQRQEELAGEVQKAAQQPGPQREPELERLTKEQQQLREDAARLSRQLRRMQANRAGRTTSRAAERMGDAADALRKDQSDRSASQQREAVQDLEQAQRELAQRRREIEQQLAHELLEKMGDRLQALMSRQQQVIDETVRLEGVREERGSWSRAQLKSLRDLVDVQQGLRQETAGLAKSLAAAEVFALAVRGAGRYMELAAARLSDRHTDAQTVALEEAARQRFADVIAALAPPTQQAGESEPSGAGTGAGNSGPPQEQIPQLAQLKVLKSLQEDLNQRTLQLDRARQSGEEFTPQDKAEAEQIALEQTLLADLARDLTRAVMEAFESNPATDRGEDQ